MKKILLGLIAVIVLAVGGFFGFRFYVQHRVEREVETAFEQIRATGAKASHGKVSYDLKSRTITIADIATESTGPSPLSVKIANFAASGVDQPDPARMSADSLELTDVEVSIAAPAKAIEALSYKVPRITVKDYTGPNGPGQPPASASLLDRYRFALERLSTISAASVTAPTITGTIKLHGRDTSDSEFSYSGLVMETIKNGKIASTRTDGVVFSITTQTPHQPVKLDGNLANVVATDIDLGAIAAMLDPGNANDDSDHRVYGHVSAGPYVISATPGVNLRIDGITIDDVGITPSRMQLPALMAMMPEPGATPPSPAQARELMEKVANIYEGFRIGNAEMRGLSIDTPQGPLKLAAMRLNFAKGKIGELTVDGLDMKAPKGPAKLGRFALTSLDVAGLMRLTAQFAGQKPTAEQALAWFPMIGGAEVKGLVAPYKSTGKPINIDVLSLDWGQFVGTIPSKLHLIAKLSGPLDGNDPGQQALIASGMDKLAVDADLGAAWTEASNSFALAPVKIEIGGLLTASAQMSLGNVPRDVFSPNLLQASSIATQIEAGTIALQIHDLGGVDLAVGAFSRSQNVSRDEARHAILDAIKAQREPFGGDNPDVVGLIDAISSFVETPGQTLAIRLTPRAKAPALQLIELLKTDPQSALAQFRIEASTSL